MYVLYINNCMKSNNHSEMLTVYICVRLLHKMNYTIMLYDDSMQATTHDCTAHSALYTPGSNAIRPLFVYTDTWCSSGQFDGNGQLVQTGGDADGLMKVTSESSSLN